MIVSCTLKHVMPLSNNIQQRRNPFCRTIGFHFAKGTVIISIMMKALGMCQHFPPSFLHSCHSGSCNCFDVCMFAGRRAYSCCFLGAWALSMCCFAQFAYKIASKNYIASQHNSGAFLYDLNCVVLHFPEFFLPPLAVVPNAIIIRFPTPMFPADFAWMTTGWRSPVERIV